MEAWVPLFNIFLNSPTPEAEASVWMQQCFNTSATITTSPSSFLSLLSKPIDVSIIDSSSPTSSPHHTKRIMWIQSLSNALQSRILSFLRIDSKRFCRKDLSSLANTILKENSQLDFWVKKAAHHLLDQVSDSTFDWVSALSLDTPDVDVVEEEFETLPTWLKHLNNNSQSPILPWLPLSQEEVLSSNLSGSSILGEKQDENSPMEVEEETNEMAAESERDNIRRNEPLDSETQKKAILLKPQILKFVSKSKAVNIASEIQQLCFNSRGSDPLAVFSLIEPWESDEETASILLSHLSSVDTENISWQCQVLCSIVLPKMLALSEPASRVLVTTTIEFCKLHQKASVDALLFPLVLRKEGINNPMCDIATRIIRECLHPAHVSSFCQKLLCGEQRLRKLVFLSCHQGLISDELVWTESLFTLFQNIINHNVYLTQDSVDRLAILVQELSGRYSRSLKFANFLLALVTKCEPSLKPHKILLTEVVEKTNTFMTRSILSKLSHMD